MGLHEAFTDGQAEAEPTGATLLSNLGVRFKNPLSVFRCDTGALVGNPKFDAGALRPTLVGARNCLGRKPNGSTGRGKLDRIAKQVGQNLFEANSIETRPVGMGVDLHLNFQASVMQQWLEHVHHGIDNRRQTRVTNLQNFSAGR
jgi:hypothetical protein